ncbi:uncharacterized protein LY89DRAFT_768241 [Mollisia scopiformis]|uniref:F-box domain-containing protein n=1 Tax=Mollisia scopiformis TaxID=149040 RepID=A0A194XQG3_MOLSC|nr:uncharacterized protein LY89DRAFT_768241 [Mollisia scopiformis]KUJ21977.1 hypothetical protein LY89DRAFT_768241 [Mollisia scopiformis]
MWSVAQSRSKSHHKIQFKDLEHFLFLPHILSSIEGIRIHQSAAKNLKMRPQSEQQSYPFLPRLAAMETHQVAYSPSSEGSLQRLTTTPPSQQSGCSLFSLPAELFDEILGYLLPPATLVTLLSNPRNPHDPSINVKYRVYCHDPQQTKQRTYSEDDRIYPAILYTCKQMYAYTEWFWDRYTFAFTAEKWQHMHYSFLTRGNPFAGLTDRLKHAEVELSIMDSHRHAKFAYRIFQLLKNCKNLQSVTLRNNSSRCPEDDMWLDIICHQAPAIVELDVPFETEILSAFACVGGVVAAFGSLIARNGPLAKVKRKMIIDIPPELKTDNRNAAPWRLRGTQWLNRWLRIWHRHWGGELRINGTLVRMDNQQCQRVLLNVGPSKPDPDSIFGGQELRAALSVDFKPVVDMAEEEKFLGKAGNLTTVVVEYLAKRVQLRGIDDGSVPTYILDKLGWRRRF